MKKASIILATYHRPDELHDCIRDLLAQTVLPYEIIVLDDGDLETPPLRAECEAKGIKYLYHKKQTRGLTGSRNIGVSMASGDILFFVDDDVLIEPDYLEQILKAYELPTSSGQQREIGGVGGVISNNPPWTWKDQLRYLYHRCFLLVGPKEGKVLPSGFCADYYLTPHPLTEITEVDFFSGGVCSYKREVFEQFGFTPEYRTHALGEDKDFSYQVSRRYRLLMNPAARLQHLEAPSMRPNKRREGKMFVMGRYLFFKMCVKQNPSYWIPFLYAHFGYVLTRLLALIAFPNRNKRDRLLGNLEAYAQIFTGRAPILQHLKPGTARVEA